MRHALARFAPYRAVVVASVVALLIAGCRDAEPAIEITEAPPAAEGGPDRMAQISGQVRGARAGEKVVLFARSGLWYVQPFQAEPFTAIQTDGSWTAAIHLGGEYAAVLVREGYNPPSTLETLPEVGGLVIAVVRVPGSGDVPQPRAQTVSFSGYEWTVRHVPSDRAGFNQYAPENVRVADDGALHLSLSERGGVWTSAEVALARTLGYGTYTFSVRDTGPLDPSALLTFYTYDESGPAENFREMATLIQRPAAGAPLSVQYVLQPNYVAANVARFTMPSGSVTQSLRWEPGRVLFATSPGRRPTPSSAERAEHEFTIGVPSTGAERIRIALCYVRNSPLPPQQDVEVVIERFQHFP